MRCTPTSAAPRAPAELPFRPVFVVGFERSGTTLLAVLLGRHSRLASAPETHFLPDVWQRAPRGRCAADELLARLRAAPRVADLAPDFADLEIRLAGREANFAALFRCLLEQQAERLGKVRPIDKTPGHLAYVPLLLDWYPEARVVCMVRDGRDAVLSRRRAPWSHRWLALHCVEWVQAVKLALYYRELAPARFLLLRFEDLLAAPEARLAEVDRFLGIEYESAQLAADGNPVAAVPAWERPWKARAAAPLDRGRVGVWLREATPAERVTMDALMGPWLARLGYADSGRPPRPTLRWLWHRVAGVPLAMLFSRRGVRLLRAVRYSRWRPRAAAPADASNGATQGS